MEIFYQFLELFATFVEGAIALFVSINLAGKKFSNRKTAVYILIISALYTAIITFFNSLQAFSFATIFIALLFTFAAMVFATESKLIYKFCSIVMTWFFMNIIEYIFTYSFIMILGESIDISKGIALILSPGITRAMYILLNKSIQITVFLAFKKVCSKLKLLNEKSVTLLFLVVTVAHIILNILTNLIVSGSVVLLQFAIILSLFFIGITIISVIVLISVSFKYQNAKREQELLTMANTMMEKNYTEIKHIQNSIRKQVHDFKNHLRTIDGLITEDCEAKSYLNELLEVSYRQAQNCNCGNEIIDSIVNCKMNEAAIQGTNFKYNIQLREKLNISPVDICAILANQIDNALEACAEINGDENKFINVEIFQKDSFIFFKVTNSVKENPFNSAGKLETSKEDKILHGIGLKSISETANKHNGYLKNEYIDGCFVCLAMISVKR